MPALILASASPRRKALLEQLGLSCVVVPPEVDETAKLTESPIALVERLAATKACAGEVIGHKQNISLPVLAADTIVVCNGSILGKPKNQTDHTRMLSALSATTHEVITAFSVKSGIHQHTESVVTRVTFDLLSTETIKAYWHSGEPKDKAGGYGIQGIAGKFVTRLEGSYSAVVGLPLFECARALRQCGVGV